jgi:hypothetical protein
MKYGCARTSTTPHSNAPGASRYWGPALLRSLKKLEHGDTLIVRKLDRLGRSRRDLITMLYDLRAVASNFLHSPRQWHGDADGRCNVADDRRSGRVGEKFDSERTRAGVQAAQRREVKFGLRVKLTPGRSTTPGSGSTKAKPASMWPTCSTWVARHSTGPSFINRAQAQSGRRMKAHGLHTS